MFQIVARRNTNARNALEDIILVFVPGFQLPQDVTQNAMQDNAIEQLNVTQPGSGAKATLHVGGKKILNQKKTSS